MAVIDLLMDVPYWFFKPFAEYRMPVLWQFIQRFICIILEAFEAFMMRLSSCDLDSSPKFYDEPDCICCCFFITSFITPF